MEKEKYKFLSQFSLLFAGVLAIVLVVYEMVPIPSKDSLVVDKGKLVRFERNRKSNGYNIEIESKDGLERYSVYTKCNVCQLNEYVRSGAFTQISYQDKWYNFGYRDVWRVSVNHKDVLSYEKLVADTKHREQVVFWLISTGVPVLLLFSLVLHIKSRAHI